VEAARRKAPFTLRIEVEVTNLQELEEALAAGADLIMLDNMDLDLMRRAVEITAGRVPLEASGNITFSACGRWPPPGLTISPAVPSPIPPAPWI